MYGCNNTRRSVFAGCKIWLTVHKESNPHQYSTCYVGVVAAARIFSLFYATHLSPCSFHPSKEQMCISHMHTRRGTGILCSTISHIQSDLFGVHSVFHCPILVDHQCGHLIFLWFSLVSGILASLLLFSPFSAHFLPILTILFFNNLEI